MSTVVMELGGVGLGPNFPTYSQTFEYTRLDEQGPATRKVNIALKGFVLGDNGTEVCDKYSDLQDIVNNNDLVFNYTITDGASTVKVQDERRVYLASHNEPDEWKQYDGEYNINLYYFEPLGDTESNLGIGSCSFGAYTFPSIPTWSRQITSNRNNHRDSTTNGSTAKIALQGFLESASGHSDLATKINALEAAIQFNNGLGTLVYGNFSQSCRILDYVLQPTVPRQKAVYSIQFAYDIGTIIRMRASRSSSRVHYNPSIKELPYCNTRSIKLLNRSGQEVSWSITVWAEDLVTAKNQLAVETAARIIPGGIEMPGGRQSEDENDCAASVTVNKFYDTPVIANLTGT